ncbi:hypothetical protein DICSQDRAFT_108732 [Dichomitus squalens LYAD-421 SS1]|uniref:Transmembrane protein n=2 Tax=Dichomitus squalens TaxID=114155 RepID=A0A4Q9MGL8_9APHY|nr:uncharacterized protein DICSQDRAFT_108732 [Dichomitus squalens LYAD-421 SS1]EJF59565.1 hypothetical protein DICSQDRAFT_108732 [Dichomitus squalens LYAD-421 SS1]TBU25927.1 hypothetical protein BD311DRAFT_668665 [Dichomitus squalens]
MVNWKSSEEIAKDGESFDRFMHTLLGLYIWEFVTSLPFDWQYLSGQRKFKWPLVFYFAGRYFLLFALIGIAIALNVTTPVNCQALYTYNQIFGNASIGLASINLSLRTMAVWSQAWQIVVLLVGVILGHWALLLHGVLLKAAWIPGTGCAITYTSNKILAATFIYTMCFDFTVLALTGWKLGVGSSSRRDRSKIVKLIFEDGLIYFMVAFVANAIATTFMILNLNAVMSIIANVPAAIASNIVACRVVRRLTNYTSEGAEVFGTTQASTLAFSGPGSRYTTRGIVSFSEKKENLQLQMDTFQAAPGEISPSDLESVRYDAAGRLMRMGDNDSTTDVEASPIEEFKRPNLQ